MIRSKTKWRLLSDLMLRVTGYMILIGKDGEPAKSAARRPAFVEKMVMGLRAHMQLATTHLAQSLVSLQGQGRDMAKPWCKLQALGVGISRTSAHKFIMVLAVADQKRFVGGFRREGRWWWTTNLVTCFKLLMTGITRRPMICMLWKWFGEDYEEITPRSLRRHVIIKVLREKRTHGFSAPEQKE